MELHLISFVLLLLLGLFVGGYGSMVGAGGGFVLMPILLLIYPDMAPEAVTSISLTAVFLNAVSGSIAYARMKRIHYRSGIIFALATVPGAVFGVTATSLVDRHLFELLFGVFMLAMSLFLFVKPSGGKPSASLPAQPQERSETTAGPLPESSDSNLVNSLPCRCVLGGGASVIVGFLSSFLGIGGGIMHVPIMVYVLEFPVHLATATSQFILMITSLTGVSTHLVGGTLLEGITYTIPICIGIVFGAQLGARLSRRMHGAWIVRSLAFALGAAGVRFVLGAVS
ncbi:MAG: sulfite exporter TauE/SafE family protein [Chloroflexaceae bacterium]|nr:sulfite exporter TauE/SafE family protein [Chloroflexaceae bacterium]